MKTESVRMHNAKRELIRHFNVPAGAMDHISRLQQMVSEGLGNPGNKIGEEYLIAADDLAAVSWLATLGKIVHELEVLTDQFHEKFEPGEFVKETE